MNIQTGDRINILASGTLLPTPVEKPVLSPHLGTTEVTFIPPPVSKGSSRHQPLRPFSTDFSASATRYSSSIKQVSDPLISKSAAQVLTKTIISDDFPEASYLGKICGDIYKSWCNSSQPRPEIEYRFYLNSESPNSSRLEIIPKWNGIVSNRNGSDLLPIYKDIIGLSNHTGACGMNAALQTIKVTLEITLENEAPEEILKLTNNIETKTPQLWKFLNNQIITEDDCLALHREMAHKLTEDFWYSWGSHRGIAQASLDTGYVKFISPAPMVNVILHELGAPKIYFQQSEKWMLCGGTSKSYHSVQTLNLKRYSDDSLTLPTVSIQQLINRRFYEEGVTLDDSAPTSLIIDQGRNNNTIGILEPIRILHNAGISINYEPIAIICTTPKHAFSIIRKKSGWFEINDQEIFSIPEAWEKDLSNYCDQSGSMIVYKKIEIEKEPSSSTAKLIKENKETNDIALPEIILQIERVYNLEPESFTFTEKIKERISKLKDNSFFYTQVHNILTQHDVTENSEQEVTVPVENTQIRNRVRFRF